MHQNIFKYIAFSLALIQLVFISAVPSAMAVTNIGTDISTNGNLTVDGALQFLNGAVNDYILKTDGAGNATWAPVGTTLGTATADDLPAGVVNTYYDPSREGVANGIATLDAGGQIPSGQIPAMAINSTYVVATIAARNVLAANEGDIAIVTDAGGGASRSYIWDGTSWIELLTPLQLYLAKSNNLSDLANFATARTNLSLGLANSPTFTGLNLSGITPGSLLFGGAGGALSQNNANLFWDNANNRLGIGTNTPAYTLDVNGDIKTGDGSLLYLGAKASPDPAGTNGAMYYNTTNDKFRCYENGSWADCIASVGSVALSSITPAVAVNSINNGDFAQTWNWSLTTAGNKGFKFGENVASTATGASAILHASTLAGSTAMPLFVENLGDGDSFRVNDSSGDVTPFLINNNGNVAIGSNSFDPVNPEKLKVDSGNDPSFNIITATGNLDNYLQMNIRNRNSGPNASSDLVATADNGTEDVNFIAMGINSSGYNVAEYSIGGPNDAYLYAQGVGALTPGGNLSVGTGAEGKVIKFHTGGNEAANERMRIDGDGLVGIGTTTPGSKLDVKGTLRLSGATSGYVGFVPAAVAGSTTYTLPAADGTVTQVLSTNGAGVLSWIDQTGVWQSTGTVLSPLTAGDDITTSGNIYTSGTGTITSAGLLTGNAGATISGGTTNINVSSNFPTNINTGTSTGAVTIGNSTAGAINITSGAAINLTGGATSSFGTTAGDINLQPGGSSTTAYVQIGAGGLGSTTPDLLALDVKSTAGDPAIGTDGAMYYNENSNTFRCHINGSWSACDTTGGTVTLQSAYNNGPTIATHTSTDIAFTLTSGDFTASGAGSVDLTPTGASSFTSGGALTLTGGAASTWSTSSGALTLTSASAATWGTATGDLTLKANGISAGNVKIGTGGLGSTTPDLLALDVKSDAGDPLGYNGAMYYNAFSGLFRCYEAGSWKNCGATGGAGGESLQQTYNIGGTITTSGGNPIAFTLTSGDFNVGGAGAVNLTPTSASQFTSGGALTLTGGAASTWGTSAGNLTLQSAGSGTTGAVKIGTGGAGSDTPDLFGLDVKSTDGDPAGFNGAMYYNGFTERFRCYQEGIWKDCDRSTLHTLQTIYNGGGTITTTGADIEFILANGDFTVSGADSVLLNPTGASSFTSGGALTLTGGATSTWGTSAGNLHLQAGGAGTTANVQIGVGGAGSATPDLLAVDVKSTAGDPAGFNGAIYYNAISNQFRCYQNGTWLDCDMRSIGTAKGDLITYTASNTPVRLPSGSNSQVLVSDSTQATGLRWANVTVADNSLDFAQFKDLMTVDANTSVNLDGKNLTFNDLTGGGALSLTTNAAPLTLTAGAASTWSTSSGALTIDSAGALNLGTTTATSVSIGRAGGGAIGLISPTGVNLNPYGAAAGNTTQLKFLELAANGVNYVSFKAPDSLAANTPYVLPNAYPGVSGYSLVSDIGGNLSWANVGGVLSGWTDNGTTVNLTTGTDNVHIGADGAATAKVEITSDDSHTLRINPYGAAAGNTGNLEFMELAVNGTNYVGFQAPDNIAANVIWTLPSADGLFGQYLTTNGAGSLSWSASNVMPTGTIHNSTMRYDAGTTAWLENANILATAPGTITIAAGQSYTGAGAVTLSSATASPLTVTSGTTGAINIGTDANAKAITIGNSTGATSLLLDAGTGGVKLGDSTSTPITRHLSVTNTVNVAAIGNNDCNTFGTTVTGAAVGDTVVATPDNTAGGAGALTNVTWSSYVSAANTVTVKVCKLGTGAADPPLQTWRIDVWKH